MRSKGAKFAWDGEGGMFSTAGPSSFGVRMAPSSELYNLVLGVTVAALRERAELAQIDLAEKVGTTKQKMSRLEQGRATVNVLLMQQIGAALGVDRERLLALVDAGIQRTQALARQLLRLPAKGWWEGMQALGGLATSGIVSVAVALVLNEEEC